MATLKRSSLLPANGRFSLLWHAPPARILWSTHILLCFIGQTSGKTAQCQCSTTAKNQPWWRTCRPKGASTSRRRRTCQLSTRAGTALAAALAACIVCQTAPVLWLAGPASLRPEVNTAPPRIDSLSLDPPTYRPKQECPDQERVPAPGRSKNEGTLVTVTPLRNRAAELVRAVFPHVCPLSRLSHPGQMSLLSE